MSLTVGALALLASVWPGLGRLLVYDRAAMLGGEVWRLLTAPLVHLSASQLWWDGLVFVGVGWTLETAGQRGRLGAVSLLSAASAGAYLLVWLPDLARYGGLSGPACGAVAYLALMRAGRERALAARLLWLGLLAIVGGKVLWEAAGGLSLFAVSDGRFRVLPQTHALGALSGALVALLPPWGRSAPHSYPPGPLSAVPIGSTVVGIGRCESSPEEEANGRVEPEAGVGVCGVPLPKRRAE